MPGVAEASSGCEAVTEYVGQSPDIAPPDSVQGGVETVMSLCANMPTARLVVSRQVRGVKISTEAL
jgi:hypothetical protein